MTDPGNLYSRKLEEEYFSAPLAIPQERKCSGFCGREQNRTERSCGLGA